MRDGDIDLNEHRESENVAIGFQEKLELTKSLIPNILKGSIALTDESANRLLGFNGPKNLFLVAKEVEKIVCLLDSYRESIGGELEVSRELEFIKDYMYELENVLEDANSFANLSQDEVEGLIKSRKDKILVELYNKKSQI